VAAQALRFTGPAFGGFGLGMAMYFASMGAGRMATPVVAGVLRLLIATAGGHALAQGAGLGPTGNFIAVALGITAYGVVMASGVRAAAWRAR